MIDEFENLFANSNEAFNLLTLASTTRVKLIGLSNDTEWLQVQARKLKVQLPELEHIVFKPYTNKEVELILA
jgi:Cdc6-like AAA superfamily ATPase